MIPQNGSEVNLPNGVCLTYRDRVLTVFQRDVPLRTFRNISRLFFWTSFNGTRVFEGSARVPADEIFGGGRCGLCVLKQNINTLVSKFCIYGFEGRLLIVGDCAYYVTYLSPPRVSSGHFEIQAFPFNWCH